MMRLLITFLSSITFFLTLLVPSASALSPTLSDLSKDFAESFCKSIKNGMSTEQAGDRTSAQLSKDLFFSPVFNEIISAPKDDLASSLSNKIFDRCGNDLGDTKTELDAYLSKLAKKVPSKSNHSFQVAPIKQKPFT